MVRFDKLGYSLSIFVVATLGDLSPFVVVPESTLAMWWRSTPDDGVDCGPPQLVQLVRAARLEFRKAKPPG